MSDPGVLPASAGPRVQELYQAIESQAIKSIEYILSQQRVNPNCYLPQYGMTPVHLSVGLSNDSLDILRLLLNYGGDPNNTHASDSVTPLHLAIIYELPNVTRALLESGARPQIVDADGKSAWDMARDLGEDPQGILAILNEFTKNSTSFGTPSAKKVYFPSPPKPLPVKIEPKDEPKSPPKLEEPVVATPSAKKSWPELEESVFCDQTQISDEKGPSIDLDTFSSFQLENSSYLQSFTATSSHYTRELSSIRSEELSKVYAPVLKPSPSPTKFEMNQLTTALEEMNVKFPVVPTTFPTIKKYVSIQDKKCVIPVQEEIGYSPELQLALKSPYYIAEWGNLQIELIGHLQEAQKTRSKAYFNYLMLDSKILKKTNFSGNHLKSEIINNCEKFEKFLAGVFYIGKGSGKRALQHLIEAKEYLYAKKPTPRKNQVQDPIDPKTERILNVWKSGLGVTLLSIFPHSSDAEASVNEAAMIDAIGLGSIENQIKGSYGSLDWSQKIKNQFGVFLLYKTFCHFVVTNGVSFQPQDV